MKRISIVTALLFPAVVWIAIPSIAVARVLTVTPDPIVVLPSDNSGTSSVVLGLSLVSLTDQEDLDIQHAFLEWTVDGTDPDIRSEFTVHRVTATWNSGSVASGQSTVARVETPLDTWGIDELDHERNGGFVRLDMTNEVREWVSGEATNYGVLVKASGITRTTVSSEASEIRLVIWYGYQRD